MDVPKSDFQDAAGAKVHFLEHPLEQTFRLFLRVDLVKRKKQTQVQTEMTKKTFFVCFADVTKNTLAVIQNQCLRKTLINSQKN